MARKRETERVMLRPEVAKALLRQLNMSRNELAELCGLTSGYMSQLVQLGAQPVPPGPAPHPAYPGR